MDVASPTDSTAKAPKATDRLPTPAELERFRAADPALLRKWLAEVEPRLIGTIARWAADPSHADDLLQDVQVRIYRRRAGFSGSGPFAVWVATVCQNICRANHRMRERNPEVPIDRCPEIADDAPGPAEQFQSRLRAATVREAIERLDEREREAVVARHLEGRPTAEVARRMEVTEKVARTLVDRGFRKLRSMDDVTELMTGSVRRAPQASFVLALESDCRLRDRLRVGVGTGAAHGVVEGVRFASGWRDLRDLALRFDGSPAFVDPSHPSAEARPAEARRDPAAWLQQAAPKCPLIRYGKGESDSPATKAQFVARLTPGGNDSLVTIGSTALLAADYDSVRSLLANLGKAAPVEARELLESVVRRTLFPCTVGSLATSLGTSVAMVGRRCRAWGLPKPKTLVSLARLFHVQRLAAWSGRPPGAIALALGWSAYSNYARSVRREMGCKSSEVAEHGGAAYVAAKLIDAVGCSRRPACQF